MRSIRLSVPKMGMNTVVPLRDMGFDQSPLLLNCMYESANELRRRPCQTTVGNPTPDSGTVIHACEHKSITGTQTIIVQTSLFNIYSWTAGTFTAVTGPTTTARMRSATMGNLMVIGDGVNPAYKYNGAAWSVITTPPIAPFSNYIGNIFHVHKGRMYAAGDPARKMDVLHSAAASASGADYWSTTLSGSNLGGFIDVSADLTEGDEVTGLTSHLGRLVVLLRNHIIFYNTAEGAGGLEATVHKVVAGEGCVSHDSIASAGDDVLFLSENGVKSLSQVMVQGDSGVDSSSIPINDTIKAALRDGTVTVTDIRADYIPKFGVYLLYLSPTLQFAFQNEFKSWIKWSGVKPILTLSDGSCMSFGTHAHTLLETAFGDALNGLAATSVSMQWDTTSMRAEGDIRNNWVLGEFIYTSEPDEAVTFEYTFDFNETDKVTESVVFNEGAASRGLGGDRIPMFGRSEFMAARLINSNITDFRIHAFESYFRSGGVR